VLLVPPLPGPTSAGAPSMQGLDVGWTGAPTAHATPGRPHPAPAGLEQGDERE